MRNEDGFSLAQVMVTAALLGGLAVGFMRLTKNMSDTQISSSSKGDEIEFKSNFRLLLSDSDTCRLSLAGNGLEGTPDNPVRFNKSDIDQDTEGLDVEIFMANQDGDERTRKIYSGTDPLANKVGSIEISSIKLIMSNEVGDDYLQSSAHNDFGEIVVTYNKRISATKKRQSSFRTFVNVGMSTNSSGRTTILSCDKVESPEESENEYTYPDNCSISLSHSDNYSTFRTVTMDLNRGGLMGIRLTGDVNGDDRFRLRGYCPSGTDFGDYLRSCQLGLGWRDSTDTASSAVQNPSSSSTLSFTSTVTVSTGGDVNEDDSFYYRLRCPNGSNAKLNQYVKSSCRICMGHADYYFSSPQKISCLSVQDITSTKWGRIMTDGDVGGDDTLFFGFFCKGEYFPEIRNFRY